MAPTLFLPSPRVSGFGSEEEIDRNIFLSFTIHPKLRILVTFAFASEEEKAPARSQRRNVRADVSPRSQDSRFDGGVRSLQRFVEPDAEASQPIFIESLETNEKIAGKDVDFAGNYAATLETVCCDSTSDDVSVGRNSKSALLWNAGRPSCTFLQATISFS